MSWEKKRVLVTGAGGFIGSHLTEELLRRGAHVRAFLHYRSDRSRGNLEGVEQADSLEFAYGDIRDIDTVREAMEDVDIVFHLAALIGIPYSYHAPISYLRTNAEGTLNILMLVRDLGISKVIHTSTSEVYGTALYTPIDEKHPLQGQSPYSASKIAADKFAEAFHLSFGLPVTIVRPFNAFGPRQSARAVIPTVISQCLRGGTVSLGNVYPRRDFNYVSNIVDGFLLAAQSEEAIGQTINIGSGRDVCIEELTQKVAKVLNINVDIHVDSGRIRPPQGEVDILQADHTLATNLIDWQPAISLERGLEMTIRWIREHPQNYRTNEYTI